MDAAYFSDSNISSLLTGPHAALSAVATIFVGLRFAGIYFSYGCSIHVVADSGKVANHLFLVAEGVAVHYGYGDNIIKVQKEYPGGVTNFLKYFMPFVQDGSSRNVLSSLLYIALTMLFYMVYDFPSDRMGNCRHNSLYYWDKTIPSKCIDSNKFYVEITIPNIVFDIATVILPVREVWRLQMGRDKKWAITTIFLLGGSVVLASIARLVLFLIYQTSENITQTLIFGNLGSSIEICLAIIAACLPPCAPLLKRMLSIVVTRKGTGSGNTGDGNGFRSPIITIGQKSTRGKNTTVMHAENGLQGSFERLDDNGSLQGSTDGLYVIASGDKQGVRSSVEGIPMQTL
ncbi:hypothetical protein F53441_5609 [Fusarium austroafricanum]|uniref:Rhodopsin domain-containing protein n=1 Tax=Fusarium austroafricanum TaxID=2364996 RepID=A0A8H4KLI1_9HYPO|nr:hypothetical protein F53441_5609 [Fusarium austroafricanum]